MPPGSPHSITHFNGATWGLCKRFSPRETGTPARAEPRQAAGSRPCTSHPPVRLGRKRELLLLETVVAFFFFIIFFSSFFFPPLFYFPSFYKKHLTAGGSWLQPTRPPAPSWAPAPCGTQGQPGPPQGLPAPHRLLAGQGAQPGGAVSSPHPGSGPRFWGSPQPQGGGAAAALTHRFCPSTTEPRWSWQGQEHHPAWGSQCRAAWSPTLVTPQVGCALVGRRSGLCPLPAPCTPELQQAGQSRGISLCWGWIRPVAWLGAAPWGSVSVPARGTQGAAPSPAVGANSSASTHPELAGSHNQTSSGRLGRA